MFPSHWHEVRGLIAPQYQWLYGCRVAMQGSQEDPMLPLPSASQDQLLPDLHNYQEEAEDFFPSLEKLEPTIQNLAFSTHSAHQPLSPTGSSEDWTEGLDIDAMLRVGTEGSKFPSVTDGSMTPPHQEGRDEAAQSSKPRAEGPAVATAPVPPTPAPAQSWASLSPQEQAAEAQKLVDWLESLEAIDASAFSDPFLPSLPQEPSSAEFNRHGAAEVLSELPPTPTKAPVHATPSGELDEHADLMVFGGQNFVNDIARMEPYPKVKQEPSEEPHSVPDDPADLLNGRLPDDYNIEVEVVEDHDYTVMPRIVKIEAEEYPEVEGRGLKRRAPPPTPMGLKRKRRSPPKQPPRRPNNPHGAHLDYELSAAFVASVDRKKSHRHFIQGHADVKLYDMLADLPRLSMAEADVLVKHFGAFWASFWAEEWEHYRDFLSAQPRPSVPVRRCADALRRSGRGIADPRSRSNCASANATNTEHFRRRATARDALLDLLRSGGPRHRPIDLSRPENEVLRFHLHDYYRSFYPELFV